MALGLFVSIFWAVESCCSREMREWSRESFELEAIIDSVVGSGIRESWLFTLVTGCVSPAAYGMILIGMIYYILPVVPVLTYKSTT